jgi:hypothetical protein
LLLSYFAARANAETFAVPLVKTNGWQFLSYRKIPPNAFRSTRDGLEIAVTNSAAPAVFPLTNALQVTELRASGNIYGTLKMPPGKQGEKGFDDYTVRVGLVELGTRKLSWRERIAAADWVKKTFCTRTARHRHWQNPFFQYRHGREADWPNAGASDERFDERNGCRRARFRWAFHFYKSFCQAAQRHRGLDFLRR